MTVAMMVGLSGCSTPITRSVLESAAARASSAASHEEYPLGEAVEAGPVTISAVYSQPADLQPAGMGLAASEADVHLEARVAARDGNELGLVAGEDLPYLTITYEITAPDGTASGGTFMPMISNHGLHYGANVALGDAGSYQVVYRVASPAENGLVLHTDPVTGVSGSFWDEPLRAEWTLDYLPREW